MSEVLVISEQAVTDLRIGQLGHGLEPRAFCGPAQLLHYDDLLPN